MKFKILSCLVVLVSLVLTGCFGPAVPLPGPQPPPYLVLITGKDPIQRCSGVAVDLTHVLTANHCSDMAAYVTSISNQVVPVARIVYKDEAADLAVLLLDEQVFVEEYAAFKDIDMLQPAMLFGHCPRYWPNVGRPAAFIGRADSSSVFLLAGCSGDSGAPVIQDDHVVGVLWGVLDDDIKGPPWGFAKGQVVFATSGVHLDIVAAKFVMEGGR